MTATVVSAIIPVAGSSAVRPLKAGDALRLYGATSGYAGFSPAATAGSTVWQLPSADGTSGQFLQTNGSGVLAFATVSTGITIDTTPITGGGSGRILFESATNKVSDSANLTWDGTKLGVTGSAQLQTWDGNSVTSNLYHTTGLAYLGTATSSQIGLATSNAWPSLVVKSNGRVRLSTIAQSTDAGAQLHTVAGSATTIGAIIQGAAAQTANLQEWQNSAGTIGMFVDSTTSRLNGQSASGTDGAGGPLNFAGGQGTGAGAPGVLNLQTAPAGTTGSSLNALVTAAQFDGSATAGDTRMLLYDVDNATLERVTVGIADSGGVGYKLLRIPN